jgi:hypothetical protein
MSARASMSGEPSTCSGAMYAGVPSGVPMVLTASCCTGSATRAMPKSVMTTRPSLPSSTLSGLRSRCTTPAACAAPSPAQIALATSTTRASGIGDRGSRALAREAPSMSSIVRNLCAPCSPMSKVRATFAWVTRRASFTSCRKRLIIDGSADSSARSTFSATSSPSARSLAL